MVKAIIIQCHVIFTVYVPLANQQHLKLINKTLRVIRVLLNGAGYYIVEIICMYIRTYLHCKVGTYVGTSFGSYLLTLFTIWPEPRFSSTSTYQPDQVKPTKRDKRPKDQKTKKGQTRTFF